MKTMFPTAAVKNKDTGGGNVHPNNGHMLKNKQCRVSNLI